MGRGVPRENKICLGCGETIVAAQYTDTLKQWTIRKFCCSTCRYDYNAGREPNKLPSQSPLISADTIATQELLKRLVRYGLRHDGLPGLPANDLLRLAAELGVAA